MTKKEPTERLIRWPLFLQQFEITIKYRPGKANQNTDCLSIIPVNLIPSTVETFFYLLKGRDGFEPTDLRPPMRNRLLEEQSNIFYQLWHDAVELAKKHLIKAQSRQTIDMR